MTEKNNNEEYLSEDKKILDESEDTNLFNSGVSSPGLAKDLQVMQIKATMRNTKAMKDMDKNTTYFSKFLGAFAGIQIAIAILQYSLSALSLNNQWLGFGAVLVLTIFIAIITRLVDKNI